MGEKSIMEAAALPEDFREALKNSFSQPILNNLQNPGAWATFIDNQGLGSFADTAAARAAQKQFLTNLTNNVTSLKGTFEKVHQANLLEGLDNIKDLGTNPNALLGTTATSATNLIKALQDARNGNFNVSSFNAVQFTAEAHAAYRANALIKDTLDILWTDIEKGKGNKDADALTTELVDQIQATKMFKQGLGQNSNEGCINSLKTGLGSMQETPAHAKDWAKALDAYAKKSTPLTLKWFATVWVNFHGADNVNFKANKERKNILKKVCQRYLETYHQLKTTPAQGGVQQQPTVQKFATADEINTHFAAQTNPTFRDAASLKSALEKNKVSDHLTALEGISVGGFLGIGDAHPAKPFTDANKHLVDQFNAIMVGTQGATPMDETQLKNLSTLVTLFQGVTSDDMTKITAALQDNTYFKKNTFGHGSFQTQNVNGKEEIIIPQSLSDTGKKLYTAISNAHIQKKKNK